MMAVVVTSSAADH